LKRSFDFACLWFTVDELVDLERLCLPTVPHQLTLKAWVGRAGTGPATTVAGIGEEEGEAARKTSAKALRSVIPVPMNEKKGSNRSLRVNHR
jgi:hypothetical protein